LLGHLGGENLNEINASDNSDNSDNNSRTQSADAPLDDGPVCQRCGRLEGAVVHCGHNGAAGLFHLPCWADERTKGPLCVPALGPVGDSLEDLT